MANRATQNQFDVGKPTTDPKLMDESGQKDDQDWVLWMLEVSRQLALALIYLEEKGFVHGNICAKNILLFNNDTERPAIKLSDPGVRAYMKDINKDPRFGSSHASTHSKMMVNCVLPPPWRSYEYTFHELTQFTNSADKWSFATTVIELTFWCFIEVWPEDANSLKSNFTLYERYTKSNVLDIPDWMDKLNPKLKIILMNCWHVLPSQRPNFMEIVREIEVAINSDNSHHHVPLNPTAYKLSLTYNDVETFEDCKMRVIRKLGQGHFGLVQLCRYEPLVRDFGATYAVKSLKESMQTPQTLADFQNEFQTMKNLDHRHIVKLKGISLPSKRLVMEYLPEGSLVNYLHSLREKRIAVGAVYDELIRFSKEICEGMIYLQSQKFIHRDLAARNIMVAQDRLDTSFYVKISDFGLSRVLQSGKEYYRGNPDEFPVQWYAPECIRDHKFNYVSDVWSFGVVLWEMFTLGEKPIYADCMRNGKLSILHLFEYLQLGKRLKKPPHITNEDHQIMKMCWTFEAEKRPNFNLLKIRFDQILSSIR